MREAFHDELAALCNQLAEMCGLVISVYGGRIEESAFRLLVLQQPVASELRMVVGSMHIAADLDRMGALAVHVADISRLRHPDCALPDEVRTSFTEMGVQAVALAQTAQDVLVSRDPDVAARLRDEDDAVDAEHRHLFTLLLDRQWDDGVCSAVDVALLGRYYERFADHAVEIGKRVIFEATGGRPEHKKLA
nr:PhoU domain-containing protein [Mycobacterium sp. DL440]